MSEIVLYCKEPQGLKLGPGLTPAELITFVDGFAHFDDAQFPDWQTWVNYPGGPLIEILPPDSDQVAPGADALACPVCERSFKAKLGLNSHLRTHAPQG